MRTIRITSLDDPLADDYRNVRDADLRSRRGTFMAEGRFVVRTLLTRSPLRARSVLVTPAAFEAIADALEPLPDDVPVLLAEQGVMNAITGFDIHRGCLAAGIRPDPPSLDQFLAELPANTRTLIPVLEDLTNHDNVGGIFRAALALGAPAVLLSPRCCDPLYRKAIRVSMGAALRLPFTALDPWPDALEVLKRADFHLCALTPAENAQDISTFADPPDPPRRIALLLGAEGDGLTARAAARCDTALRIPIAPDVDSLNVVTAGAIALHRLSPLNRPD